MPTPDNARAIWWVFALGVLATLVLLAAVVSTLVLSQRRYLKLRRSQARRVLEAQEEERAWVSREVHDDAVQRLLLIGRALGESNGAGGPERIHGIQGDIEDLSVFLRGLAHRLHPALIDKGGLSVALRGLAEELERGYGLEVTLALPAGTGSFGLPPQRALVLFRIAQEALHNVVKHAKVKQAEVSVTATIERLELTVRDRGAGFEAGKANGAGIGSSA